MINMINKIANLTERVKVSKSKKLAKAPILKTTEMLVETEDSKLRMNRIYYEID